LARHQDMAGVVRQVEREDGPAVLPGPQRLRIVAPGAAYNLLLHTGPFHAVDEDFHWHWELVPRLTHEAGLEWGGGVYITPLLPERAAAELRLSSF